MLTHGAIRAGFTLQGTAAFAERAVLHSGGSLP